MNGAEISLLDGISSRLDCANVKKKKKKRSKPSVKTCLGICLNSAFNVGDSFRLKKMVLQVRHPTTRIAEGFSSQIGN